MTLKLSIFEAIEWAIISERMRKRDATLGDLMARMVGDSGACAAAVDRAEELGETGLAEAIRKRCKVSS